MAALPQIFKTADLPDTGGVVKIPDGQYHAVIVESELKPTKDGGGQFLALKIVITEGQYTNTEFIERLNIVNKNQTAVDIAFRTLARISEAVGMTSTPQNSEELHGKKFLVDIGTEKGKPYTGNDGEEKQGSDKSIIKKYHPIPKVGGASSNAAVTTTTTAASTTGKMPWQ